MVPMQRETAAMAPHRSFKIKPDFGSLRIGICEPTIWSAWKKIGRINGDAERFMVSLICLVLVSHGAALCMLHVLPEIWREK